MLLRGALVTTTKKRKKSVPRYVALSRGSDRGPNPIRVPVRPAFKLSEQARRVLEGGDPDVA